MEGNSKIHHSPSSLSCYARSSTICPIRPSVAFSPSLTARRLASYCELRVVQATTISARPYVLAMCSSMCACITATTQSNLVDTVLEQSFKPRRHDSSVTTPASQSPNAERRSPQIYTTLQNFSFTQPQRHPSRPAPSRAMAPADLDP